MKSLRRYHHYWGWQKHQHHGQKVVALVKKLATRLRIFVKMSRNIRGRQTDRQMSEEKTTFRSMEVPIMYHEPKVIAVYAMEGQSFACFSQLL